MIQYRVPNPGLRPDQVAECDHPTLVDLRRHGPWQISVEPDGLVLTQSVLGWSATEWSLWQDTAIPGRRYRMAVNQPALRLLRRPRLVHLPCLMVELACGDAIRIPAALADGSSFAADGSTLRPASAYGKALVALLDRSGRGEHPPSSEWLACVRLAIQAGHRLTDDAISERDLIAHTDVEAYLEAMTHVPKAEPAAGA